MTIISLATLALKQHELRFRVVNLEINALFSAGTRQCDRTKPEMKYTFFTENKRLVFLVFFRAHTTTNHHSTPTRE